MTNSRNGTALRMDRELIDGELSLLLRHKTMPEGGPVHEAMRYAVLGGGQRLRPVLAVRTGRLAGAEERLALRAGAAVEILHCASLIIDDLPCMDDEQERRGRMTVHVAFGEATAVLAAFGLVALAARSVVEDVAPGDLGRALDFQRRLLEVLDCGGLIAGQAMDLQLVGASRDAQRDRLTELKTVPLFQLAVEAGLAFGDATPDEERELIRFGRNFGLAYQMMDDLLDGEESSPDRMVEQSERVLECLRPFGGDAYPLEELIHYLHAKAGQTHYSHR